VSGSRLRQARENTQGDSSTVSELQATPAENTPDSPQNTLVDIDASSAGTVHLMVAQGGASPLAADTMIMTEDLLQYDTPWHHIDSMMNIRASPENDSRTSQSSFTPSNLSPLKTSSPNCTCNNIAGPCSSHVERMRAQILAETNAPHIPEASVADDITPRFGIVLEAIRQAGFQDMEQMVLAYYTSRFEWGSFPAMVQCVSRKRRLKAMLQELQKSSGQWPRWEYRGLHESVSEAAVSLCVDEMERLTKSLPVLLPPSHNETANLVSALEWLLRDQGCGVQSYIKPGDEEKLEGLVENAPDTVSWHVPSRKNADGLTTLIDATSLVFAHGIDRSTRPVL
jgi:hypothetical protein